MGRRSGSRARARSVPAEASSASSRAAWVRAATSCAAPARPKASSPARTAPDEPQRRAEGLHHAGPGSADPGRHLPQGSRRPRRDPRRLQEHRRSHGQPVRPRRGGARAEAGTLRQRLIPDNVRNYLQPDPQRHVARLTLVLGLVMAIGPLAVDMYLPAMPTLQREFAVDASRVQHTLSAYLLGLAIGQLGFGPIADRFGRKAPLVGGLVIFAL